MHERRRSANGSLVFGLIVVLVGAYYLLQNNFGFRFDLNWDLVWPVVIVLIGAWIIFRALTHPDANRPA